MTDKDEINPYNLTQRQLAFCNAYLVDGHGTNAAIKAGYVESGAHVESSRLLRNVKIQQHLYHERMKVYKALAKKYNKDDIIAGFLDLAKPENSQPVRQRALDSLARIFGMNDDKLALAGSLKMSHDKWVELLSKEKDEK